MQKQMLVLDVSDAQKLLDFLDENGSFKQVNALRQLIVGAQVANVNFPDPTPVDNSADQAAPEAPVPVDSSPSEVTPDASQS
jgi:hypothetical protein